jgi:signal transduction histidine kinase
MAGHLCFGDYRLAAVVAVVTIGSTLAWHPDYAGEGARPAGAAGLALLAAVSAALVLRRRYPAVTLGIVGTGVAAYFALGNPAGLVFLPLVIAFGGAILSGHRLLAWVTCPVVYAFVIWGPYYIAGVGHPPSPLRALTTAGWPLLVLCGAEVIRAGRERAASMARGRAEHSRHQAEQARRRTSEERVRIAQELHDVVAHNISLINVQAGVALHLMDSDGDQSPEQARAALTAIKQASKETLGELRSVLGILRAEPGDPAPLTPTAGLDQLDGLIAGATSAGLTVDAETTGDRVPLPPSTDLAAYRIVQEALTNVMKHAGPAAVMVRLRYGGSSLAIEVTDDGGARAGTGARTADDRADGGGSGIPGMRERTRMLGGEFSAGPLPGGGFRVSAVLPLRRYVSAEAEAGADAGAAAASAPGTGRDGAA